ncbi:hypothetical protein FBQ82_01330 [Anaerolineae bacterium CFX7]|nr:hypothetical protein [Anaerolineae bacterium CFX7]
MDWNEWEPLTPTVEAIEEATKVYGGSTKSVSAAEVNKSARGAVRTHKPDVQRLTDLSKIIAEPNAQYFTVRLGFEFELDPESRKAGARYSFVRFTALLRGVERVDAAPRVYDLFPKDLYEGEPRTVKIEFGPEISANEVGVSLGNVSTDIQVGTVSPAIVAYKGRFEREPRWELTPKQKELVGMRNTWLIVEVPNECKGARLSARVEADIETKWGPIAVAPQERVWENRPSIVIG